MKQTINDFARNHNAKKHTIYARIKKLEKENPQIEITETAGNRMYLTDLGLRLLEENLKQQPIITQTAQNKGNSKTSKNVNEKTKNSHNKAKNSDTTVETETLKLINNTFEKSIKSLESQLEIKDKQIKELQDTIKELNKTNFELVTTLKQSLTESHALTYNAQTKEQLPFSSLDQDTTGIETDVTIIEETEPATETPKQKKGFWKTIFGG